MGVRQMVDAGEQAAKELPVGNDAADGNAAESNPVIAALTTDQTLARALAFGAMIRDCDLQRCVDRFRSGIGEENVVEIARQELNDFRGQFKGERMANR